jgi:hypothetical protein
MLDTSVCKRIRSSFCLHVDNVDACIIWRTALCVSPNPWFTKVRCRCRSNIHIVFHGTLIERSDLIRAWCTVICFRFYFPLSYYWFCANHVMEQKTDSGLIFERQNCVKGAIFPCESKAKLNSCQIVRKLHCKIVQHPISYNVPRDVLLVFVLPKDVLSMA